MLQYDPTVMTAAAEERIRQGVEVRIVRTVNHIAIGFILGLIVAFGLELLPADSFWLEILTPGLVITGTSLILGGVGFLRAVEEAKELRFNAHMLLCQVEIERHLSQLAEGPAQQ